jgi:hypothetical protein
MGITQVFERFSQVKSGVTSVDSGHPSMSQTGENIDRVKELVLKSRRMTTYEVTDMLGISFG